MVLELTAKEHHFLTDTKKSPIRNIKLLLFAIVFGQVPKSLGEFKPRSGTGIKIRAGENTTKPWRRMKLPSDIFGRATSFGAANNWYRPIHTAVGKEKNTFDLTKYIDECDAIGSFSEL